jgi:ABC-type uncharacterized transport system auxiliary subunit
MKTMNKWLLMSVFVWVLSACGNSTVQTKKYFRINSAQMTSDVNPFATTLVVKRPTALSILGGRPMVATQDDQSLVQLSSHFWLESPKVLLQDILLNWAGNHWQAVTTQTPHQQAHQTLNTRILAFEKHQLQAKVSLEFNLYDEDNALLVTKQYVQTMDMQGEGYRAFAKAIGTAIDAILNQFSDDLSYAVK